MIASAQYLNEGYAWHRLSGAITGVWSWLRALRISARPTLLPARAMKAHSVVRSASGRLDAVAQWAKLSTILLDAGDRAREAAALQATATRQLDLAHYGLITLRDELSAVMAMPSRRDTVVVHVFGAAQGLTAGQEALAA